MNTANVIQTKKQLSSQLIHTLLQWLSWYLAGKMFLLPHQGMSYIYGLQGLPLLCEALPSSLDSVTPDLREAGTCTYGQARSFAFSFIYSFTCTNPNTLRTAIYTPLANKHSSNLLVGRLV